MGNAYSSYKYVYPKGSDCRELVYKLKNYNDGELCDKYICPNYSRGKIIIKEAQEQGSTRSLKYNSELVEIIRDMVDGVYMPLSDEPTNLSSYECYFNPMFFYKKQFADAFTFIGSKYICKCDQ